MTIGARTYAKVEDVESLIGDIVENRKFTNGTIPSTVQVETELDNVAADLNRELDQVGYTIPVVLDDYPTAYEYLKAANAYGAAAVLLSTVPATVYNPDEEIEQPGETRAATYGNKLKSALKAIRENRLRAGRRTRRLEMIHAGSQEDEEGNTKDPIFTRHEDIYPGLEKD